MKDGEIVQIGTPIELFEKPKHTFVGHFIGSPGMNVLPCEVSKGQVTVAGTAVEAVISRAYQGDGKRLELGVRPEFVHFADKGIPVEIVKVADAGRFRIVETRNKDSKIRLLVREGRDIPSGSLHVTFDPGHTQIYEDGWMVN